MPPKKKVKVIPGQLIIGSSGLKNPSENQEISSSSSSSTDHSFSHARKRDVDFWQRFGEIRCKERFPWLSVKDDGVYCVYCTSCNRTIRSGIGTFVLQPHTGTRPDKLMDHQASLSHQLNADEYRLTQTRIANKNTLVDIFQQSTVVSVDEAAFCDAMKCLYFLVKHEMPHTTLFSPLRDFSIMMGNEKLSLLDRSKNVNYRSEQTIQEMLEAINCVMEADVIEEVSASPFFFPNF